MDAFPCFPLVLVNHMVENLSPKTLKKQVDLCKSIILYLENSIYFQHLHISIAGLATILKVLDDSVTSHTQLSHSFASTSLHKNILSADELHVEWNLPPQVPFTVFFGFMPHIKGVEDGRKVTSCMCAFTKNFGTKKITDHRNN